MTTALDFPAYRAARLLSELTMELVGVDPDEILAEKHVARQAFIDASYVVVTDSSYPLALAFVLREAWDHLDRYFAEPEPEPETVPIIVINGWGSPKGGIRA